eukprot:2077701-Rhodomonas_salina.3
MLARASTSTGSTGTEAAAHLTLASSPGGAELRLGRAGWRSESESEPAVAKLTASLAESRGRVHRLRGDHAHAPSALRPGPTESRPTL